MIWSFYIGENIKDENRDFVIIDKKYENYRQYYKIKCNKCGFDCGEHYNHGEFKNEHWIIGNNIKKGRNCPCCCTPSRIVVPGINDIATTDSWLIPYFEDKTLVNKFTASSDIQINPICPFCNNKRNKLTKINYLYKKNGFGCPCKDTISYPNKFAYFTFMQLKNQCLVYEREYQPKWAIPYFYDNYIELSNNQKIIIEMDGLVGHGNVCWGTQKQDIEGLKRDIIKDNLAVQNNIKIIRIDSKKSNFEYIKENFIKQLSFYFDFKHVDWKQVEMMCHQNFTKIICEYYEQNKSKKLKDIAYDLNICQCSLIAELKIGRKFNWCSYKTMIETKKENINKMQKIGYEKYTPIQWANFLGVRKDTIYNYIKELNE